jgi:asparagine synthase (glutamine-hydrolysing)
MSCSTDLKYAKKVAEYLGTDHTEVIFTVEDAINAIPNVIYDIESYDITTVRASIGMWLLCKYISENTDDKVIFSGEGSDELLCGYLYFHYAPTPRDCKLESKRLLSNLYKYDVLRADRCVSSHGLELRVPFLDQDVVNFGLSLPDTLIQPIKNIEKYLLRESFKSNYLPDDVLWRKKEAFSDGVSGEKKSLSTHIQEYATYHVYNDNNTNSYFEGQWYKEIFYDMFPAWNNIIEYWLPKWVNCNGDPSARVLNIYNN